MRDGSVTGSAVWNANLFINQLSTTVEPYLSGSFGIVLDDAYKHAVIASVVVIWGRLAAVMSFHIASRRMEARFS